MSNYRNPRPIHPPLSPVMPGSSTPIDIVGSPHSPSGIKNIMKPIAATSMVTVVEFLRGAGEIQ